VQLPEKRTVATKSVGRFSFRAKAVQGQEIRKSEEAFQEDEIKG